MATSKLQRNVGDMLDKTFPQYRIRENYRPDWLISSNGTKLELDFYVEEIRVALEVQGDQHFGFIEFFHGDKDGFEKRKLYDQQKKDLCHGAGVKLIEICTETDAIVTIRNLSERYNVDNRLPVLPPPSWRTTAAPSLIHQKPPKKQPRQRKTFVLETDDENKLEELKKFSNFFYRHKNFDSGRFEFLYLSREEQKEILRQAGL